MSKPMTNYNERLDEILAKLPQYNLGQDPITDKDFTPDETFAIYPELAEAKQAILDWHNKQVEEVLDRLKTSISKDIPNYYDQDGWEVAMKHIEAERNKLKED